MSGDFAGRLNGLSSGSRQPSQSHWSSHVSRGQQFQMACHKASTPGLSGCTVAASCLPVARIHTEALALANQLNTHVILVLSLEGQWPKSNRVSIDKPAETFGKMRQPLCCVSLQIDAPFPAQVTEAGGNAFVPLPLFIVSVDQRWTRCFLQDYTWVWMFRHMLPNPAVDSFLRRFGRSK